MPQLGVTLTTKSPGLPPMRLIPMLTRPEPISFRILFMRIVGGKKTTYERKIRRLDGKSKWVLISASPIFDSEKRCIGSVEMATDFTERKKIEIGLRQSKEFNRAILKRVRSIGPVCSRWPLWSVTIFCKPLNKPNGLSRGQKERLLYWKSIPTHCDIE